MSYVTAQTANCRIVKTAQPMSQRHEKRVFSSGGMNHIHLGGRKSDTAPRQNNSTAPLSQRFVPLRKRTLVPVDETTAADRVGQTEEAFTAGFLPGL